MSKVGAFNPEWLSKAAFNDTFDWAKSLKTTFPEFLKFVTLHDSYWETINLTVSNETILSIKLDAFWNKAYTLRTENTDHWPFLIIEIPNVLNISYNTVEDATTISNASSVAIRRDEVVNLSVIAPSLFSKEFSNRLLNCKELHRTRFDDIYGGNIEILHTNEIYVLLLEEDGTYTDATLKKTIVPDNSVKEIKEETGILTRFWNRLTKK